MGNINFRSLSEAIELSAIAYNSDENEVTGDASTDNFAPEVFERYEVEVLVGKGTGTVVNSTSGEVVYGFKNKSTGDLFVVARGTDNELNDYADWYEAATGKNSDIGATIAYAAQAWSDKNNGQTVVATGHSLGGTGSAEAAARAPNVISQAINVLGPATGSAANVVTVNNSSTHPYDFSLMGLFQAVIDLQISDAASLRTFGGNPSRFAQH